MKLHSKGMFRFILILVISFGINFAYAQDDADMDMDMEAEESSGDCKPASFETPYDKYQKEGIELIEVQKWYSFGQEEYKHKQYAKAAPYFWKVLVNDNVGTFKVTYSKLATCYAELAKQNTDNRVTYLDSTLLIVYRGLEKYPDNTTLHYRAGSIQRARGKSACAVPHYEALIADKPKEKNYYKVLADLLFRLEDERCIEVQQQLIDLDPDNLEYRNTMVSMVTFFGGDPLDVIRKAFESDTTNIPNAIKFGKESLITGNYKNALRAFNAVVAQDANHTEAMEQMAKAYEGLSENGKAIDTYKKVLAVDNSKISTHCALARVYINQNSFSTARRHAFDAIRINRDSGGSFNGEPYLVLGEAYTRAAEYCSNKRADGKGYSYDDKLVFEKAAAQYRKAEEDPNFASTANSRRKALVSFFRTKEDKFMTKRDTVKDDCYGWLK